MLMRIYKSGLHFGEEPIVHGNQRSGMIVFSGCHLSCKFCYTPETSVRKEGTDVDADGFVRLCEGLVASGAANINLISPSHVWGALFPALRRVRNSLPHTPIILKPSGYESPRLASEFAQCADVIVPDFKVWSTEAALSVHLPPNYGTVAKTALSELMKTHGTPRFSAAGKLQRGIVVRHLYMPGYESESERIVTELTDLKFRGGINFMTGFWDGTERRLRIAPPSWSSVLSQRAAEGGMTVLVNGRLNKKESHDVDQAI